VHGPARVDARLSYLLLDVVQLFLEEPPILPQMQDEIRTGDEICATRLLALIEEVANECLPKKVLSRCVHDLDDLVVAAITVKNQLISRSMMPHWQTHRVAEQNKTTTPRKSHQVHLSRAGDLQRCPTG